MNLQLKETDELKTVLPNLNTLTTTIDCALQTCRCKKQVNWCQSFLGFMQLKSTDDNQRKYELYRKETKKWIQKGLV